LEGELASLAKDAEDLQRRQTEWTKEDAQHPDSAAAAAERDLATATDSLAQGVERAGQSVPLQHSQAAARRAQGAMEEAARSAWRQETLDALNRALAETAALARRQEEVAYALRDGEAGASTRARQAAVEEGTHAIEQEISAAAGRHALVSPQLAAALGYAQNQMKRAREQLEQGDPNPAAAAPFAEQALDALNATAHALVRTAQRVAGAQSGSGFQEALEQLARMAQEQQGMNGDAQGLLPMMGPGGDAVMQRLRELAGRQRALAEQLERLQAGGDASAAGALAEEARELARQLEAGRLDRRTIERQERLYRKLLDAGRSLQGEEPDEQKELTPEQRRMVLEYFRRLNEQKP